MNEQLNRIRDKIGQLKKLDANFTLFGSQKHGYEINPVISIEKIRQFELTHQVTLPTEYVEFVTEIGNGGVGPFYGFEPLESCLFDDLDYKRPDSLLNPGKPFLHKEPWNLKFISPTDNEQDETKYENELSKFEEQYFDKEQMNGVIAICNCGCAISLNLVVNGKEYGNIWTDDRSSDNGIYPSHELGNKDKITLLDWYELWLNNALQEIEEKLTLSNKQDGAAIIQMQEKPWWKIW